MTDYNDGKWHGWNGGERPVHPDSVIEAAYGDGIEEDRAKGFAWSHREGNSYNLVAFRVTKEHKELREWWIDEITCLAHDKPFHGTIHVREVTE